MKYYFSYSLIRLPFCCGVYEVGNFSTNAATDGYVEKHPTEYRNYKYNSIEEANKAALEKILETQLNFCIQFWFYKPSNYNGDYDDMEYTEDEFRQVVKAHPNCVELAEYVNKNSGNMINGFMINNNTSQIKSEVYSDEEDDDYDES